MQTGKLRSRSRSSSQDEGQNSLGQDAKTNFLVTVVSHQVFSSLTVWYTQGEEYWKDGGKVSFVLFQRGGPFMKTRYKTVAAIEELAPCMYQFAT